MKGQMIFASSDAVFEAGRKFMVFTTSLGPLKVSHVKEAGTFEKVKGIFGKTPRYTAFIEDGLTDEWIAVLSTKDCWIRVSSEE